MPQVNPIVRKGLQDKAIRLMLDGKPDVDIAKELGVTRQAFYAYKKKARNLTESVQAKGMIRLEISQENALSELSGQMLQYTENYERSMQNGDEKGAYAWSARRIDLLEKMLKVTGLYEAPTTKQEPIMIRFVTVEGRDRAEEVRAAIVKALEDFPDAKAKALQVLEEMNVVMRSNGSMARE
jgi:hypothetical protein